MVSVMAPTVIVLHLIFILETISAFFLVDIDKRFEVNNPQGNIFPFQGSF